MRWPEASEAMFLRLYRQGLCDGDIARIMELTRFAVNGKRRRMQLEAHWERGNARLGQAPATRSPATTSRPDPSAES